MSTESTRGAGDSAEQPAHYFRAPDARVAATRRDLAVQLAGRELVLTVSGGVFSTDRVDLGTRVLLREVPQPPPAGDLLDLGCGWGPIALSLGLLSPAATVWAVDVNPQALALTTANAGRAGLDHVRAVPPDRVPETTRFAAIWSNPPIRIGKAQLHDLLLEWLPRLLPQAAAHLVVQRNLGADSLHRWLAGELGPDWTVGRAGSAKGYRVLRVIAPPHRD